MRRPDVAYAQSQDASPAPLALVLLSSDRTSTFCSRTRLWHLRRVRSPPRCSFGGICHGACHGGLVLQPWISRPNSHLTRSFARLICAQLLGAPHYRAPVVEGTSDRRTRRKSPCSLPPPAAAARWRSALLCRSCCLRRSSAAPRPRRARRWRCTCSLRAYAAPSAHSSRGRATYDDQSRACARLLMILIFKWTRASSRRSRTSWSASTRARRACP